MVGMRKKWATIKVKGPRYKTGEWVRENFFKYLEDQDKLTPKKMTHVPLESIANTYPDEWADFCVLEGVSVVFK